MFRERVCIWESIGEIHWSMWRVGYWSVPQLWMNAVSTSAQWISQVGLDSGASTSNQLVLRGDGHRHLDLNGRGR